MLFLDRNHDRARAYIDRARSAQAEQQRISEALVHEGLEAFDRGEVVRARALLSDALDQGASHDVALGVLGRIDRLDVGHDGRARRRAGGAPSARSRASPAAPTRIGAAARLPMWWITAAAIVLVGDDRVRARRAEWPAPTGSRCRRPPARRRRSSTPPAPLPMPSPTEAYVAQARALFASGKLRDALRALDRVPVGDALAPDAERLRADIQRELLAVAGAEASSASSIAAPVSPPRE